VYDPDVARCTGYLLVLLAPLAMGSDCEGNACPPAAPPMSAARAKEIDPAIVTGLAVSTTHVFGDCRPGDPAASVSVCGMSTGPCARERAPLRVFVVPVNVSVAIGEQCAPAFSVDDTSAPAAFDGYASDLGELVVPLESGRYTLFISADDRCAVCALSEEGGACTVDIQSGVVTVRELVLDRSTH
jgi:hypothetical protein